MQGKKRLLVDMHKLGAGYCGLWEVAHQFGLALTRCIDFSKWDVTFLVPKNHPFTDQRVHYKKILYLHRFFLWIHRYDAVHGLAQCSPYLRFKNRRCKYVCTIHDLNFLYTKNAIKIKRYRRKYQRSLKGLSHIVFISQYTAQDARRHLKAGDIPWSVIYNGAAKRQRIESAAPAGLQQQLNNMEYLLLISTFMIKKNVHLLVDMMKFLPDLCLVVAGQIIHRNYYERVLDSVRQLGLESRIFFMGEVGEEQKYWLYDHCRAFVFPSTAEGFGIPPIEAMRAGKPVFASRCTSIPEICGDMAFYWPILEGAAMADIVRSGMVQLSAPQNNPVMLREFAAKYDWDKCAGEYVEIYENLLKSKRINDKRM